MGEGTWHDVLAFGTAALVVVHQVMSWVQRRKMRARIWRVEATTARTVDLVRSMSPDPTRAPTPPAGVPVAGTHDTYARQEPETSNPYLKAFKPPEGK